MYNFSEKNAQHLKRISIPSNYILRVLIKTTQKKIYVAEFKELWWSESANIKRIVIDHLPWGINQA